MQILALVQDGTICFVSVVKKNHNDLIRTEGGVAFQRNLEFVKFHKFQVTFLYSGFVTGWLYMPSLFGKKMQNDRRRTAGGIAFF